MIVDFSLMWLPLVSAILFLVWKHHDAKKNRPKREGAVGKLGAKTKEPNFIELGYIQPQPPDWIWQNQKQIPYRPWHDGPYHVNMGLKTVDLSDWIEIDKTYLERYELKRDLFTHRRDEVLQVLPGSEDAAFEALYLLRDVLVRRYPSMFCLLGRNVIKNFVTGDVWDISRDSDTWKSHHPLEIMALLATDDFIIMQTDNEGVSSLRAGAVCFPGGWRIKERIGHSLWQIHAENVPQYENKLSKSMDKFFVKMRVGSPIQRSNYAIYLSGDPVHIASHHTVHQEEMEKPLTLQDLHLRVERQVLQRLPASRALLFTIRTYITPIEEVTKDVDIARALRTNIDSYTSDVALYKNKALWETLMRDHLDEVLDT